MVINKFKNHHNHDKIMIFRLKMLLKLDIKLDWILERMVNLFFKINSRNSGSEKQ